MTEQEKMLSGKIYDPSDEILSTLRVKAHKLSQQYNNTFEDQTAVRKQILDDCCRIGGKAYIFRDRFNLTMEYSQAWAITAMQILISQF